MKKRSRFIAVNILCCCVFLSPAPKKSLSWWPHQSMPPVCRKRCRRNTIHWQRLPSAHGQPACHKDPGYATGWQPGSAGILHGVGSCVCDEGYHRRIGTGLPYVTSGSVNSTVVGSPSFVYNQVKSGGDCLKGSQITSALKLLHDKGVRSFGEYGLFGKRLHDTSECQSIQYCCSKPISSFKRYPPR